MPAYDPDQAAKHLTQSDPDLAAIIDQVGPPALAIRSRQTIFQALLKAIVYQQLAGKAAAKIHGRVVDLLPKKPSDQPSALVELSEQALRGAGLSANKQAAARDLAAKVIDGTVPSRPRLRRMDDHHIIERLTAIRGVGRWTVEMLLIFTLGRSDVLPATDFGVRKGFMLTYGLDDLPAPQEILQHGACWQPYRSIASWYMWRAVDLEVARQQAGDSIAELW